MRRVCISAFMAFAIALNIHCAQAAWLDPMPEVLPDANGVTSVTLTVDAARLAIAGAVTFTTRAYHYNGAAALHGPLLVLQAGGRLNLTLVNNLKDDTANDANRAMNTFKHVNKTNVHTHGLHVDPAVDNVFTLVSPGGTLRYDMPIPASHAPGLHWYHSHSHGASTLQVMGGLVGAMYVKWLPRDNIPAAMQAMTTTRLIMQLLNFANQTEPDGTPSQTCSPQQPGFNPFATFSFAQLEDQSGSTLPSNPVYAAATQTFYTINAQYQPTVAMAPGESRLFQLVYAAGSRTPRLTFPSACTTQNIAFDGVYFNGAPRTVTSLQLITASRVEFVITCPTAGTYSVNVAGRGGNSVLYFLQVSGTAQTSASLPATLAAITRPSYLADLTGSSVAVDVRNQVSMSQAGTAPCKYFLGMGTDCSGGASSTCAFEYFAGAKGTTDSTAYHFRMRVGQIAEWTAHGVGNAAHPLHIHVNHMQITGYTGTATLGDWVTIGDWRDTIPVLAGVTTFRFPAADISGETMLHCHELSHEDRGLMSSFLILPALDSATSTATASSTAAGGAATASTASTTAQAPTTTHDGITATDPNGTPPSPSAAGGRQTLSLVLALAFAAAAFL